MDMIEQIITLALSEDSGLGDITSESILEHPRQGSGVIVAKQDCILAGTDAARRTFQMVDPDVTLRFLFQEAMPCPKGMSCCGWKVIC